jgi:S-DNA-T family DNA segregation ATPase FtsK/SpoIIIE
MLFRNTEKLPRLSAERTIGIVLFFINLLSWFHLAIDGDFPEARLGTGGGFIGAAVKLGFVRTLGKPGATVALVAWLLISLILTLDLSMATIVKWLGQGIQQVVAKAKQGFTRVFIQMRERRQAHQ